MHRSISKLLAAIALAAALPAVAQDAAHGSQLYHSTCITCHGLPPVGGPELAANNPGLIAQAINGLVPAMSFMRGFYSSTDLADIAAYVASLRGGSAGGGGGGVSSNMPQFDYTDLWWNPGESGWGLNIVQHASGNIFAVIYTYDAPNRPMWYVMPGGTWSSPTVFTGALYRVTGSPALAAFKAGDVTQVGTATFSFSDASNGSITYSVNGVPVQKTLQKQPF